MPSFLQISKDGEPGTAKAKAKSRLVDMDTQEVSLVDRAANGRTFLVVKNAEGVDMDGELLTDASETEAVVAPTQTRIGKVLAQATALVSTLKGLVESSTDAEGDVSETPLPDALGFGIRAAQQLVKGAAGETDYPIVIVTRQLELVEPSIHPKVKKGFTKTLVEVEKRLTKAQASMSESTELSTAQVNRLESISDILGKVLRTYPSPGIKAAFVARPSIKDPEVRKQFQLELEQAMLGLSDLHVALDTDAHPAEVAKADDVASLLHQVMGQVETAAFKITTGVSEEPQDLLSEAVTKIRSVQGALVGIEKNLIPPEAAMALRRVMVILGAVMQRFGTEPGSVGGPELGKRDTDAIVEALMNCGVDVAKIGRAMQKNRLNRLKGAMSLLKDAVTGLRAGEISFTKFKQINAVLGDLINELQVEKSATRMRGMEDPGGLTPDRPNVGSGVQPDTSVVAGTEAVMGDGVPGELGEILKQLKGQNAELAKKLGERDAKIDELSETVSGLKKVRVAPSAPPDDDAEQVVKTEEDSVAWPSDMNDVPSNRAEGARI